METSPPSARTPANYTCFIRLPFPRGSFIDPPPVIWNTSKDRTLWKIVSQAASNKDINWTELSDRFEVSLPFLLQQAAWLYERHFTQMKAQMKKLGATNPASGSPSPVPPQEGNNSGVIRPPSAASRATSALSNHTKDASHFNAGPLVSPTSNVHAIPMTRTLSGRTVTMDSRQGHVPPSPRDTQNPTRSFRSSFTTATRKARPSFEDVKQSGTFQKPVETSTTSSSSSSLPDEALKQPFVSKSNVLRGNPDLKSISSGDDEDEESHATFLPFATKDVKDHSVNAANLKRSSQNTLRSSSEQLQTAARESFTTPPSVRRKRSQLSSPIDPSIITINTDTFSPNVMVNSRRLSSDNTTIRTQSSPSQRVRTDPSIPIREGDASGQSNLTPGSGLDNRSIVRRDGSPRIGSRNKNLTTLSPRQRVGIDRGGGASGVQSKDGSDGTPSMGSSFSDLDDASVTQSALEDALLSNIQRGGVASRMSSFSQALKSKYLSQMP